MIDAESDQNVQSSKPVTDDVNHKSLEMAANVDEDMAGNKNANGSSDANEEKVASPEDDAISTLSTKETKVNFGFLPIPKRCRITPTHPFKFNLAINILFGFASTSTVIPHGVMLISRLLTFTIINQF
jgi:hypothetical protein